MPNLDIEQDVRSLHYKYIAGVDEVGRGPLAGPVVSAAVVLPHDLTGDEGWLGVINDSKKLSESKRQMAYEIISREAVSVAVGITNASTIDSVGILPATISSMFTALRGLEVSPDFVLFDFIPLKDCEYPYRTVVKGDTKSYSISAASIIAKVTRDELMKEADEQYPGYGFSGHKGYGTAKHLDAIKRLGPCEIHRRSFAPIKNYVRI
ncbi:MAG: ribonuclease HII [Dehalococcoidia bacterium]|nr:ribonuclease HII [Dehalococcoidia bacterium]